MLRGGAGVGSDSARTKSCWPVPRPRRLANSGIASASMSGLLIGAHPYQAAINTSNSQSQCDRYSSCDASIDTENLL